MKPSSAYYPGRLASQNSSYSQFPRVQTPPRVKYAPPVESPRGDFDEMNRMTIEEINLELD